MGSLILGIFIGIVLGLMIGTYLGAQIIDERNAELKYLRDELSKAAYKERNSDLYELYYR